MKTRTWLVLVLLAFPWTGGCATRAVPTGFPVGSAASDRAAEAKPAPPPRSLREDPPLPGENVEAWTGLRPEAPPAAAPSGAHDHHAPPASPPGGKP